MLLSRLIMHVLLIEQNIRSLNEWVYPITNDINRDYIDGINVSYAFQMKNDTICR